MARPQRCRRIRAYPEHWSFSPEEPVPGLEPVVLSLDEYESIRAIDLEGMTQEQCAAGMEVGRSTVAAIYDSARRKLAQALVEGRRLRISGGSYQLADQPAPELEEKAQGVTRIAVSWEEGQVFQHFGRSQAFKLYDVQQGRILSAQVVDTAGRGHGALAGFLKQIQADALICGGIGAGARAALTEAGISFYPGVSGPADQAAQALAEGRLSYDPETDCGHHGHDCAHDLWT